MVQKLRICVIGGSGFIGINLCKSLSRIGFDITATARSASSLFFMKKIFADLPTPVNIVYLDCLDPSSIKQFVRESLPYDLVINATGYAVQREQDNAKLARQINTILPLQLLKAFDGHSRRFIHLGSSYEYGSLEGALAEDMEGKPDTLYGRTKLDGTKTLFDHNLNTTKLVCLRMFGIFGPHETLTKLFPLLYSAHYEQKKLKFSHGLQQVDYMHIENVGDAITCLMKHAFQSEKELYNIGSANAYSIREISSMFANVIGSNCEINWGEADIRSTKARSQYADISKIFSHAGWIPSFHLEEGIRQFIREHQDQNERRV